MTKKQKYEIKVNDSDRENSIHGDSPPEAELSGSSGIASPDGADGSEELSRATVSGSVEDSETSNETETVETESDTQEVQDLETRLAGMTANWQRERAAFQNYKHRVEKERADVRKYAYFDLALDLLRVLDYFESSVSFAQKLPEGAENVVIGVKYTIDELIRVLGSHGITRISINPGDQFEPGNMDAADRRMMDDMAPGTVIEVQRSGWMLHDRVLRPAQVIVAFAPETENTDEQGGEKNR